MGTMMFRDSHQGVTWPCHTGFMRQLRSVISHSDPEMNLGQVCHLSIQMMPATTLVPAYAEGTIPAQVILKQSKGRAPDRVVLIGHSLGGAVAQLAALWATLQFPRADVRAVIIVAFGRAPTPQKRPQQLLPMSLAPEVIMTPVLSGEVQVRAVTFGSPRCGNKAFKVPVKSYSSGCTACTLHPCS